MINDEKRDYLMSDAELCMFTSTLCDLLTRDLADLAVFGVTAAKITELKALGDAFEVFPTDGSVQGDVMMATEQKNLYREQVLEAIRNMALRVEIKWGIKSSNYRLLDLTIPPSKQQDDTLLATSRTVHSRMTEFLTDLTPFGLTQQLIDDYEATNEQFEMAVKAQRAAVANRDILKRERILKGNEIYQHVSNYCNIGKRIYEKTNSAKYNDYLIYEINAGTVKSPTNLRFDIASLTLSWDVIQNATSYQLEFSTDSINFSEVFSGSENTYFFEPPEGNIYFRVRGRNANGYGEYSEILSSYYEFFIQPPGSISASLINPGSNTVALNWSSSNGAAFYRLYISTVNIGEEAGTYSMVGQYNGTNYMGQVPHSKRHYFYVISGNNQQLSSPSMSVYIDIP